MVHPIRLLSVILLPLVAACDNRGNDDSDTDNAPSPTVRSNDPSNGASDLPINTSIQVTFSEAMDPDSLASSFTVRSSSPAVSIEGRVIVSDDTAVFWPSAHLAINTEYIATVSTDAMSARGMHLDEEHVWTFTTGTTLEPGLPVNLGTAGNYAILAKTGISSVPTSSVTGDIAVSPAAATYITGFSLTADPTDTFSTSPQVTGKVFASDYAVPTPTVLTTAVSHMLLSFTDAAGRAPDVTELGAGNIGGLTLEPGVYAWGTGVQVPTDLTLSGNKDDVWIFQIAQDLIVANGVRVGLAGGALPENVFWQVAGRVEIGTTAHIEGIVLSQTSITLNTGATANGRLLAQTAVDLDSSVVVQPNN